MALTEQVILEIRSAEAQLNQLEARLDALSAPITVPIDVEGTQALTQVRQQIDAASGTVDIDVDTFGLESADQAFDELNTEIRQTEDELQQAQRRADSLGDELDRVGTQGSSAFSRLRQTIGPLAATLAAGIGIREVVQQLQAAVTAAADLEQSIGGVQAVFGAAAAPIFEFAEAAAEAVGLSELAANTLAARLGGQLQAFGFSAQEAVVQTQELIQVGADLAATYGGSVSDAIEAISALLRGETNPIERYAIAINQTAINAEALRLGLVQTVGQIDLQVKAVAALSLLNEQAARSQGQFAREADTTAGAMERMHAEFANAQAEIGGALIPAFEQGIEIVRDLIPVLSDLVPIIELIGTVTGATAEQAAPFFAILADAISDVSGAIDSLPSDTAGIFDGMISAAQKGLNPLGALSQVIRDLTSGLETGITESALTDFLELVAEKAADGKEPVELLGGAFEALDEAGVEAVGFLQDLADAAGASDAELLTFANTLINNRDALGLTADEVAILRDLIRELIGLDPAAALDFSRRGLGSELPTDVLAAASALDVFRESADRAFDPNVARDAIEARFGDLPVVVTDLESLRGALDVAGLSLQEFLDTGAGDSNIVAVFTEAETEILGVIASIEEAVPSLRETLLGAFDVPVDEETDKITGDIDTFLQSLEEQAGAAAALEFDLSRIQVVAPDLAQLLADAGLEASDIAAAFAADLDAASTAEALIAGAEGMASTVAENYAEFLKTLTPQQTADLGVFAAENFVSNAIRTQLADTAEELAEVLSDALGSQTIAPELTIDLSNSQITGVLNLGQVPVNGGFSDTPGTGTATPGPSGPGGAVAQSQPVSVTINNPVVVDESTAGAQAAQQVAATVDLLAARTN